MRACCETLHCKKNKQKKKHDKSGMNEWIYWLNDSLVVRWAKTWRGDDGRIWHAFYFSAAVKLSLPSNWQAKRGHQHPSALVSLSTQAAWRTAKWSTWGNCKKEKTSVTILWVIKQKLRFFKQKVCCFFLQLAVITCFRPKPCWKVINMKDVAKSFHTFFF